MYGKSALGGGIFRVLQIFFSFTFFRFFAHAENFRLRAAAFRNGCHFNNSFQRHFKSKYLVALFGFKGVFADVKRDLRQVGIYLYNAFLPRARLLFPARDMHEGNIAPIRLVQVEGVFFHLSVVRYKPLVVHSLHAAFVARGGSEVEHIPYVRCPQPGALRDDFYHLLVVFRLVLQRIIAAAREKRVSADYAFAAVFGKSERAVGKTFAEIVQPDGVILRFPRVPAEIMVVGNYVGGV